MSFYEDGSCCDRHGWRSNNYNKQCPGCIEEDKKIASLETQLSQEREKTKGLEAHVAELEHALKEIQKEIHDAACCIQAIKDGNDDENTFNRLRSLRHSFFGDRDAGLMIKKALQSDGSFMLRRMEKLEEGLRKIRRAWINGGAATEEMRSACNELDHALDRVEEEK